MERQDCADIEELEQLTLASAQQTQRTSFESRVAEYIESMKPAMIALTSDRRANLLLRNLVGNQYFEYN
jgi:hypothetical protein